VQLALKVQALAADERTRLVVVDRLCRALEDGEQLQEDEKLLWVHIPRRLKFRGGRAWMSGEAPRRARVSRALAAGVRQAHALLEEAADEEGVMQQAPGSPHERTIVRLAWLAPDLQLAFLEGRQKPGLCLEDLRCAAIPLCWDDQRRLFAA